MRFLFLFLLFSSFTYAEVTYFSFSKKAILPSGKPVLWSYSLKSDGRFEWSSSHNKGFSDQCGSYAGELVINLSEIEKKKLFKLVDEVIKTHKEDKKKKPIQPSNSRNTLTVRKNNEFLILSKVKFNTKEGKDLLAEIKRLQDKAYANKKNRAFILAMDVRDNKGNIDIILKNQGHSDITLNLGQDTLIYAQNGRVRKELKLNAHSEKNLNIPQGMTKTWSFNGFKNMKGWSVNLYKTESGRKDRIGRASLCGGLK
jgi:hypothetical protein